MATYHRRAAARVRLLYAPHEVFGEPWSMARATLSAAVLLLVDLVVARW